MAVTKKFYNRSKRFAELKFKKINKSFLLYIQLRLGHSSRKFLFALALVVIGRDDPSRTGNNVPI